ncbi:unnamed protein product [Mucor hiemalis]
MSSPSQNISTNKANVHEDDLNTKAAITNKFSASEQQNRDRARNQLMNLVMKTDPTVEQHIARTNKLINIAQTKDVEMVSRCFLESLPSELYKTVNMKLTLEDKRDLDKVINTTRSIYALLFQSRIKHQSEQRNAYNNTLSNKRSNRAYTDEGKSQSRKRNLHCKYHPKSRSHTTDKCIFGKNKEHNSNKKSKTCRKCKATAFPGHKCKGNSTIVPTKTRQEESEDNSGDINMDSSDSDTDKQFNAITVLDPMLCLSSPHHWLIFCNYGVNQV